MWAGGEIATHPDSLTANLTNQSTPTQTLKQTQQEAAAPKGEVTELSRLEIRVGKIVEISQHPDADTLYVEKIDVGEAEPRTIVSGLVKYQSEAAMQGRDVIVLCNLKPRAMRGVTSHGMLLCASNDDHSEVVPLAPPAGAAIGDLITVEGHASAPEPPGNRAGKAYDRVADELFVDEEGRATFKGVPFMVAAGAVTGAIKKGKIS
jgi:methionine--tRNA ligase beta chain